MKALTVSILIQSNAWKVFELLQRFDRMLIHYTLTYRRLAHLDSFVPFFKDYQNYNVC